MPIIRRQSTALLLVAIAFGVVPTIVQADIVLEFTRTTDPLTGSGHGSVLEIMDLQNTGTESGSITRVGSLDVVSGNVTNQTDSTISVAQLEAAHTDPHPFETDYGFELILDLAETGVGDTVSLDQLTLYFTDALGAVIPGVDSIVTLAGTPYLIPQFDGPGVGGAGWVFDVRFTPDQWATFIATDTNRIGISATISGTVNGPETFFLRPAQVAAVPEPSGVFLLSLLAGAGVVSRVTRRRKRPLAD